MTFYKRRAGRLTRANSQKRMPARCRCRHIFLLSVSKRYITYIRSGSSFLSKWKKAACLCRERESMSSFIPRVLRGILLDVLSCSFYIRSKKKTASSTCAARNLLTKKHMRVFCYIVVVGFLNSIHVGAPSLSRIFLG
jgi:hypothetical protein